MQQTFDLNSIMIFWRGDDKHEMIFGYKLPHSTLAQAKIQLPVSQADLRKMVEMVTETERRGHAGMLMVQKGIQVNLPLPLARHMREQIDAHLTALKNGTLKCYDREEPLKDGPSWN